MDNDHQLGEAFVNACKEGDMDAVQSLIKAGADITHNNSLGFLMACGWNHIEIVKFLLTSKEIEIHCNINSVYDRYHTAFGWACLRGNKRIVDYLLFSKDLIKHAHIERRHSGSRRNCSTAFSLTCSVSNCEMIKYITKDLKHIFKIKKKDIENGFVTSCAHEVLDNIDYFLENHDHQLNDDILSEGIVSLVAKKKVNMQLIYHIINNSKIQNFHHHKYKNWPHKTHIIETIEKALELKALKQQLEKHITLNDTAITIKKI